MVIMVAGSSQGQSMPFRLFMNTLYEKDFPVVEPLEAEEMGALFLDSREREEYDVSHIHNAKWVGFSSFELESLRRISIEQPIVIYCTIGARSQKIGQQLVTAGFTEVYNLYGGVIHWKNQGLPVYHQEKPTENVHTYSRWWGIWLHNGKKVY